MELVEEDEFPESVQLLRWILVLVLSRQRVRHPRQGGDDLQMGQQELAPSVVLLHLSTRPKLYEVVESGLINNNTLEPHHNTVFGVHSVISVITE